jgi:vitamin B12 transporter
MKYLFLLGCSFVVSAPALAQEDNEITVLATGFAEPQSESGQAISVIDQDRLEQLQSVTISDALRSVPGVSVAQRGTVGSQTSVFLRGGNSSQTLVLIDGVRVNDPSSPNAAFDFGTLLVGNTGRIEVLRGPNSIIWGSQAIGGVVNVETIKPAKDLAIKAGIEYGHADTLSARANVSGSSGIVEASLGGSYYRTDGISALTGGTELDGSRIYALNGRVKVSLTPDLSLDLRGYFTDNQLSYDSNASGGGTSLAEVRNKQAVGYAGVNFALADGRFQSRLAYTRTHIDRVGVDPVVFSFNNYDVSGSIDRFEYRGSFKLSDMVTLVAGAEHERIHASTSFEGFAPDIADDRVTSGYAQLSLKPLEGLTLTGGVRHDAFSDYGGHTTLGGNIAWSPNGGATVLRATYGEGFRAPTLTEGQPPFGNPALKPETASNLDLGIEQTLFGEKLRASATWFRRRSADLISFSSATGQSENVGQVDTDGLELSLAGRVTGTLQIEANYTLTNAINRSATNFGKRLQLRPQHSGSIMIDWKSPLGVKLGGTLALVGDSFDDAANAVRLDRHALVTLRASWPVTGQIELFGRVENLGDEQYQTVAGYGTYGRSAHIGARARF